MTGSELSITSSSRYRLPANYVWIIVYSTLLALSLALGGYASAAGDFGRSVTEGNVARAKSKADHEALAQSYEEEAKALDAKAAEHEGLARTYAGLGYWKDKRGLISHCASLVDQYRAAAKETRELARAHHELAAEATRD